MKVVVGMIESPGPFNLARVTGGQHRRNDSMLQSRWSALPEWRRLPENKASLTDHDIECMAGNPKLNDINYSFALKLQKF